ncbi:hypothetical protein DPMN_034777 [Dreissena polymorpha]|uniref:Uncharacterized protein n=1 Tax=Dreissena polymorpha TaxID=45954 RepID=A0A9D4M9P6_DREPO|nr:hypothetical protein DPMN_034777 [Dreissena polymorpha]
MLIASHAKKNVSAKEKHSESEESSTSTHSKRRKLSTPNGSSGISGVQEMSDFTDIDHNRWNNPDPPSSPDAGAIRDSKDATFQLEECLDISFSHMESDIEVSNVPDVGPIEAEVHGDFGDEENDEDEEDNCSPKLQKIEQRH